MAKAAITHRNTQTANATTASSITITKPTSTASGDVLIAIVYASSQGITITAPDGFTAIPNCSISTSSPSMTLGAYYKVAGGSEPASYEFSFSASVSVTRGVMSAWTAVNGSPVIVGSNCQVNSSSTVCPVPAVTAQTGGARSIIYAISFASATSTPPSGYTELFDQFTATGTFTGAYATSTTPVYNNLNAIVPSASFTWTSASVTVGFHILLMAAATQMTASMTPAGAILKTLTKSFAASLTTRGAIIKTIYRNTGLGGSIGFAGSFLRSFHLTPARAETFTSLSYDAVIRTRPFDRNDDILRGAMSGYIYPESVYTHKAINVRDANTGTYLTSATGLVKVLVTDRTGSTSLSATEMDYESAGYWSYDIPASAFTPGMGPWTISTLIYDSTGSTLRLTKKEKFREKKV